MAHTARNASQSPLSPNRPVTHVLLGGQFDKLGEAVEPGFLSAITGNSDHATLPMVGFGDVSKWRSVLADWIANPANPLTARVMVNRIWQGHFGAGIVATSSDFGKNGARPTDPELLDWLALQFVDKGWSIKAMHRLILTSSTYRQSSEHSTEAAVKLDPANTLLWWMNRQRLEGEELRDSILAVSGRLNPERGGPELFRFRTNWLLSGSRIGWCGNHRTAPGFETFGIHHAAPAATSAIPERDGCAGPE